MTMTRIKLSGPADRDSVHSVDVTPTWAGIMPAICLALTHGTPDGQRMARGELERLAREVDAANATAREDKVAEPKPPAGEVSHLKTSTAALASVLAGYGKSNAETAATARTDARAAFYGARAAAFYHSAGDAAARGGNDSGIYKADAAAAYESSVEALQAAESALAARTEERDETAAALNAEEGRTERLAAALLDVAALLHVALSPRATLDRGQALVAIRDAERALGRPVPLAHARDGDSV